MMVFSIFRNFFFLSGMEPERPALTESRGI
jgi:hypothetical protein